MLGLSGSNGGSNGSDAMHHLSPASPSPSSYEPRGLLLSTGGGLSRKAAAKWADVERKARARPS